MLLTAYHFLSRRTSALPILLPLILAAIAAGRTFGPGLLVAASLLQLAAILTSVLMIGEQPDWQAGVAGAIYLTLSALGGMALLFGLVLADLQRLSPGGLVTVPFVVAVLSVGFALQWGVAPLYFWLPNAYQRAGPGCRRRRRVHRRPGHPGAPDPVPLRPPPAGGGRVDQPPACCWGAWGRPPSAPGPPWPRPSSGAPWATSWWPTWASSSPGWPPSPASASPGPPCTWPTAA